MEGKDQLEHEILRHLAMAKLCSGVLRAGHIEAARQLESLRDQIGGEEPRQKSKSAKNTRSPLRRFWERKAGCWPESPFQKN